MRNVSRRTALSATKLATGNEAVPGMLKSINIAGEQSFRNLIVLRRIFYVFFPGHKTGRIESGRENLQQWNKMIILAHEKADARSLDEVKMLSGDVLEAQIIRQMASEIFIEISLLPEPKTF